MKTKIRGKCRFAPLTFTGILMMSFATPIRADSVLALLDEQLAGEWNGFIGGVLGCTTGMSYDAETFGLSMRGACTTQPGTLLRFGTDEEVNAGTGRNMTIGTTAAKLDGVVDNNGRVLGGSMSIVGSAPALGIYEDTALVSGSLIDVCLSPDCLSPAGGSTLMALIKIETVIDPLKDLGDWLLWSSNGRPDEWGLCNSFAVEPCQAWKVSVPFTDQINGLSSQYFFYDSATLLSEPKMFLLLGIGLAGMGFAESRKKRRIVNKPAEFRWMQDSSS